jgi:4-cresol dehydrogenase (hydroxylating) flavoprotein subunit
MDTQAFLQKKSQSPAQNCTGITKSTSGISRPQSKEEVISIVQEARRKKMKLHPVSTGKNWGYGSATPYKDDTWILDLSLMDKILDYDPELHVIRIQPGVTQKKLYDFLSIYGHQDLVPTTGAGGDVSLLGNSLERGYGLTPWTDHFLSLTAIEAVLPSGELYQSPFLSMGAAKTASVYKWGIGPYYDGLFSQSDLGIVTEASLMLHPRPENISLFFCLLQNREEMLATLPVIRELFKNYGTLFGGVNLLNDLRILSMTTSCPQQKIQEGLSLSETDISELCLKFSLTPWSLVGTFYGNNKVAKVFEKDVKKLLKNHKKSVHFFDKPKQKRIASFFSFFPFLKKTTLYKRWETLSRSYQLVSGQPSNLAHQLTNWRNPEASINLNPSFNPDQQNSGLIWYAPLICLNAKDFSDTELMIREICRCYGFDFLLTFIINNQRYLIATLALVFN